MVFSLIIIVKNREQHLKNVIRALDYATLQPTEIIVVRMNEPRKQLGRSDIIQVELHDTHALPLARARNTGAKHATCDMLVFLDVDCIPSPTCFAQLLNDTDAETVSMVDPRYLPLAVTSLETNKDFAILARQAQVNASRKTLEYGISTAYELFWSLGFGVQADTYRRVNGFDENFSGYGGEDTDFAFRLRQSHIRLNFSKTKVYHQPHGTVDPPLNWLEDIVVNARVFRTKWGMWPMTSWLAAFKKLGFIEYDNDSITIKRLPTTADITAASRVES